MTPALSIVIIGRNEGQRLTRCLQSVNLARGGEGTTELIYVDSASTDGSPQVAAGFGAQVIVLHGGIQTAARARNAGWQRASAPYILFLDGDTLLHPQFIQTASKALESDPSIAAVWGHRRELHPERSIYNRVLEHVITQAELKEQLNLTVADLVKDGTLTQADVDSIVPQQRKGGVLSDNQRDHLALRLSQVLTLKTQLKLNQRIYNRPDAPVSYPFLWDIPQHDYVQWDGIAANAGLGPIGRNTGEVIGV